MPTTDAAAFLRVLLDAGVRFFAGVPDSVLANLCFAIHQSVPPAAHVVAANEGGAVAAAAGHYLATGRPAVVYMQNSGQGNAVNPLASLLCRELYGIPALLLIGWRGEPGRPDEAEHHLQGRVTFPLLDLLGIPAELLPEDGAEAAACARRLLEQTRAARAPVAAVVRAGTFGPMHRERDEDAAAPLTRERAIELVIATLAEEAIVVTTTGKTSRELYELRERARQRHDCDFLMVGSMGHASQLALGLALGCPRRPVVCLDGDGAAIMHMGGMAVIGGSGADNLRHVILNNGSYDSVGGQPTPSRQLRFADLALACRYRWARRAGDPDELLRATSEMLREPGPSLLEVRIRQGARSDLGRPRMSAEENLAALRRHLSDP